MCVREALPGGRERARAASRARAALPPDPRRCLSGRAPARSRARRTDCRPRPRGGGEAPAAADRPRDARTAAGAARAGSTGRAGCAAGALPGTPGRDRAAPARRPCSVSPGAARPAPSRRRRAANSRTPAVGPSSHCASSTATTTVPVSASDAEHAQKAERNRALPGRIVACLGEDERLTERALLRHGKPGQHLHRQSPQQIPERREREPGLRAGRPAREHPAAREFRRPHSRLPDRRLTDPSLTLDHERARPLSIASRNAVSN